MSARTVLVTGASGGLGGALAAALAPGAAEVHLVGRDPARLEAVAARVREHGARGVAHAVDLAAPGAAAGLGRRLAGNLEALHVLVHAAGPHRSDLPVGDGRPFAEAELEADLRVHLLAPQALVHELGEALRAGGGDVVLISSSVVRHPRAGVGSYAAAKAGLDAWAACLRAELNPAGVRVLTVHPGRTATPLQARLLAEEGRPAAELERLLQPESVAALVRAAVDLPRTAEVTELHVRPALPPRRAPGTL